MEVKQKQYKDSKIGRIPADWKVVRLDEIIDFTNGKGHEKFIDENGEYIVVNSKFISREGEVRKYSNELFSPLKKDDITMVMSDVPNGRALAKCFLIDLDNKYTLNQRICGLRVKDLNQSLPKFYYYVINRNKGYLKHNDGAGQTNLRRSEVLECLLQSPSFTEQQKIADILSTVDEQVRTTQEIIDKSKELKKGLMQKLFKEGLGHTEFKETKCGRIPKNWEVILFKDLFDFISTCSHSKVQMTYDETNSNIFNIHYGAIHTTYKEQILDFNKTEIPRIKDDAKMPKGSQLLKDGDVVIVDASEDAIGMGECVELKNTNGAKVIGGLHTYAVRDNKNKTADGFRGYIFSNNNVKKILMSYANESKVFGITKSAISLVPIVLPTLDEQKRMALILAEADVKIENEEQEKVRLEQLKKGLMQQLLTGKKRFKV